jgi:hypothetical protein
VSRSRQLELAMMSFASRRALSLRLGTDSDTERPVGFANSRGDFVFVDQSAEEVVSAEVLARAARVGRDRLAAVGWQEAQRTMRPVLVVMPTVDAEHLLEVASAEDENAVEAVGAEGAHPAFGVGVGVWRLDGRPDHVDALGPEDFVEGGADLRVAVVDEKADGVLVAELHDEVAGLLGYPTSVRL